MQAGTCEDLNYGTLPLDKIECEPQPIIAASVPIQDHRQLCFFQMLYTSVSHAMI